MFCLPQHSSATIGLHVHRTPVSASQYSIPYNLVSTYVRGASPINARRIFLAKNDRRAWPPRLDTDFPLKYTPLSPHTFHCLVWAYSRILGAQNTDHKTHVEIGTKMHATHILFGPRFAIAENGWIDLVFSYFIVSEWVSLGKRVLHIPPNPYIVGIRCFVARFCFCGHENKHKHQAISPAFWCSCSMDVLENRFNRLNVRWL